MSILINLDDAITDLVHILLPYEHDNWEHETFYDKDKERFIIRYRQITLLNNGERFFSDFVTFPVKYDDAIRILKENNSTAFYFAGDNL